MGHTRCVYTQTHKHIPLHYCVMMMMQVVWVYKIVVLTQSFFFLLLNRSNLSPRRTDNNKIIIVVVCEEIYPHSQHIKITSLHNSTTERKRAREKDMIEEEKCEFIRFQKRETNIRKENIFSIYRSQVVKVVRSEPSLYFK